MLRLTFGKTMKLKKENNIISNYMIINFDQNTFPLETRFVGILIRNFPNPLKLSIPNQNLAAPKIKYLEIPNPPKSSILNQNRSSTKNQISHSSCNSIQKNNYFNFFLLTY